MAGKMEQRRDLLGVYVFMRMQTVLSNFMRNLQNFTASLVLHTFNVTQP